MCEAQAFLSGVAILHRGSPKDGMRQCSLVQKSQWGNEAFALRVILGNNGDRCITKAFATIFLIALEIMKPLQLCDDSQFTSSLWLISCKHRLGVSSKGVGGSEGGGNDSHRNSWICWLTCFFGRRDKANLARARNRGSSCRLGCYTPWMSCWSVFQLIIFNNHGSTKTPKQADIDTKT